MEISLLNGSWVGQDQSGAIKYIRFTPDSYIVFSGGMNILLEEMRMSIQAIKINDKWTLETPLGSVQILIIDQDNLVLIHPNGFVQALKRIDPIDSIT